MEKWYSYLTLRRPPMPGGIPHDGLLEQQGFDQRKNLFGMWCWGIVIYNHPLTENEISEYELAPLELGYERETL